MCKWPVRPPAARKAEIDKIKIQPARNDVLVGQSRPRGARALGNRRAVIEHWCHAAVCPSLADESALLQADVERTHRVVRGEIDGEIPQLSVGETGNGLVAVFCVGGDAEGVAVVGVCLGVKVKVEAARAGERHMIHLLDVGHDGLDGHILRVGGEAHPSAGGLAGEGFDRVRGSGGDVVGQTFEDGLGLGIPQP